MGLGTRISELRKGRGMTQEQLAQHLGTTRQAVSKWESDKSEPDISTLIRLGILFGVSMDYLLLGKESGEENGSPSGKALADNKTRCAIPFLFLLVLGISVLLMLPLFASWYRTIAVGPTYADANNYLTEWPMLGVVFLGVLLTALGAGGLVWIFPEKIKKFVCRFVDIR